MRRSVLLSAVVPLALVLSTHSSSVEAQPAHSSTALRARSTTVAHPMTPTVQEDFSSWSSGRFSTDDLWQKNGDWTTGWSKNRILMTNARVHDGRLDLVSPGKVQQSGEIQSAPKAPVTFSYGYYQTRMKVASTSGVCSSFFFIANDYGLPEIDVEFLTDESWLTSSSTGRVHLSVHKDNGTVRDYRVVDLAFNPSRAMHTYGFVIAPNAVTFDIDGRVVWRDALPTGWAGGVPHGFIMANIWTGNPYWGGGPPSHEAVSSYDWMRYYAGATERVLG
ncbi:putative Beta-glucanase [Nostocoides japonicum T1-X7]|uniref:licheninase n=1 Tax=Nostocoides japonicum T1-X7 TaxID=1194083 RepID=A0A077M3R4_9MICO|nr:family 16 glycosylhydrolase [Tetrasphaera japonica]CCH78780.1 putative Beta-glucanase [Tetrasphaera japonica T1-X7]